MKEFVKIQLQKEFYIWRHGAKSIPLFDGIRMVGNEVSNTPDQRNENDTQSILGNSSPMLVFLFIVH